MAVAGSGGWIPSVRVCIVNRRLVLGQTRHNVPPRQVWMPEYAAARFLDCPAAYIYVPVSDGGGTVYLHELLVELDVIDPFIPTGQRALVPWTTGKIDADARTN